MTSQSTQLATLANIDDIVEGRNKAIALWMGSYEAYHTARDAAALACIGGGLSLRIERGYNSSNTFETDMTEAYVRSGEGAEEAFRKAVTRLIDRRCWQQMLDILGFGDLLDAKAKAEWRESLEHDPPEFTAETCQATFGHIYANRTMYFQRGIADLFSKLDRRFRSHGGFKFGNRVIIENAIGAGDYWFSNYERRDVINDIERTLCELAGEPAPRQYDYSHSERQAFIARGEEVPEWNPPLTKLIESRYKEHMVPCTIEGEFLAAKLFKNRNIHLWFRNKALQEKLNLILAEYYGEVLGDGYNSTEAPENPSYHSTPAKNFGEFFTPGNLAERIFNRYVSERILPGVTVLEPSAGQGALARHAVEAGAIVDCVEIQAGNAHELAKSGLYRSVECRDFLHLDPPLNPARLYDIIVMNPPFDRGRDCDHVRHAWKFLKPGGRLFAIMAARAEFGDDARHKALHAIVEEAEGTYGRNAKWFDLPERSFASVGTNVNTVLLSIRKPMAAAQAMAA